MKGSVCQLTYCIGREGMWLKLSNIDIVTVWSRCHVHISLTHHDMFFAGGKVALSEIVLPSFRLCIHHDWHLQFDVGLSWAGERRPDTKTIICRVSFAGSFLPIQCTTIYGCETMAIVQNKRANKCQPSSSLENLDTYTPSFFNADYGRDFEPLCSDRTILIMPL